MTLKDLQFMLAYAEVHGLMEHPFDEVYTTICNMFDEAFLAVISIDAWEEQLLYEKDCNTLYDEYESLSKEDEDNFLRYCCSIKAKELFESLPYEDYEVYLIGQALSQLAKEDSWKQF